MNIVIIGAGSIGRYAAALLSNENHNVTVIDQDKPKLDELASSADVATRKGSGSDWMLLDELLESKPDLLLALTNNDETNLVACSLGKQLGYPFTIARVHDSRYLTRSRLDFGRAFGIDIFVCPELLAANEVLKYIKSEGAEKTEFFAHGAVEMHTLQVPQEGDLVERPLCKMKLPSGVMLGLIYRPNHKEGEVIFPHGTDRLCPGDKATFIGEAEAIKQLRLNMRIPPVRFQSVVIAGGTTTAFHLAKLLEGEGRSVRLIEKNEARAAKLAELLPATTILHHEACDIDFLRKEKINHADLFVAATRHDEVNFMAASLAKEAECKNVMMILSEEERLPLLQKMGIVHAVSPVISATNMILSRVTTGSINTLVSLYGHRAEVIEATVSPGSKIVGIPLSDLGPCLPKDFLLCIIQNRGRIMVANGSRVLSPGDNVIVISHPKAMNQLEEWF